MRDVLYDLRSSIRTLKRRPFYPIMAIVIMALGLSASVAVFTYVNAFYQPFPGVDAVGLVRVFGVDNEGGYQDVSYLDFLDYAGAGGNLDGIAATQPFYAASVRLEHLTEVAFLEAVSGDYFSVLSLDLTAGRGIMPDDDRAGAAAVAVISHSWWQRSFNSDPSVIGSTIYLNFRPFTLVGVMSREFLGVEAGYRPDVWIPLAPFADRYTSWTSRAENRDIPLVRVYGRVRDGSRHEQAVTELEAIATGLDDVYPRQDGARSLRVDPATWIDPRSRAEESATVRLMMVTAGVLLLLVCANVANLLLSVAVGRQREITLRAALGASPVRLIRQVLVENILLASIAGGIAMALAGPVSARIGSYFAAPSVWGANVAREAAVDLRVVIFAVAIAILTGVVAGVLPAIRASRRNLLETLTPGVDLAASGRRRVLGRRLPGINDMLVSAQVALSIVLLVVAGLVLRTLVTVGNLDPGFSYDHLVVTHISTSSTTLEPEDRDRFFREVPARLSEEPWVRSATVADYPLLSPHGAAELRVDDQSDLTQLVYSRVIPGFFDALDIEVLQGRSFTEGDTTGARDVAIVNRGLVERLFGGREPIGRRIWWPSSDGATEREYEIVGVVSDTKTRDFMADVEPTVYFSYPQHSHPTGNALMVVANGDPAAAVPVLYRWLRDFEPHLAIINVVTYNDVVSGYLYTQRMNAEMYSVLAFLGLGLAAVGIFSVMSLAVGRRTREIGIRMSIGAHRIDIARLVIGRALIPVTLGIGAGLIASFAMTGMVRSLLFGVEPTDPTSVAAGTAVLVFAALLAAYLPAHRAARVDPVEALRVE